MDNTLFGTESKQNAKDNSQDEFDKVKVETIEGKASRTEVIVSRWFYRALCERASNWRCQFTNRKTALAQKEKPHHKILPFVMQFQPALKGLKKTMLFDK